MVLACEWAKVPQTLVLISVCLLSLIISNDWVKNVRHHLLEAHSRILIFKNCTPEADKQLSIILREHGCQ